MRAHSSTHRHRHDTEPRSDTVYCDPSWRWNGRTAPPAQSSGSASRGRSIAALVGLDVPAEEPGAGGDTVDYAPSRLRSTTAGASAAAFGGAAPYVPLSKPLLSPPLISGQSRVLGPDADGRDARARGEGSLRATRETRRTGLGHTAPLITLPPSTAAAAWMGGRVTTAAEEATLYGLAQRIAERGGGGVRAVAAPSPLRLSSAAVAGVPLRTKPVGHGSAPVHASTPTPSSYLIPPPLPQDAGKLVVVLDLDETLVYSRGFTLYERPGVVQLLKTLKGRCELIVWTAGAREYALDVIKVIDTVCAVQHCIYRHPMWWSGDAGCAKDLRLLGRPMDRVVLVDNTPSVFSATPRNSLLVPDFVVPTPLLYNAQEKVLATLTDIFDHVFRRFAEPCLADILASKRITRQVVCLEHGNTVELNALTVRHCVPCGWAPSSRASRPRYAS